MKKNLPWASMGAAKGRSMEDKDERRATVQKGLELLDLSDELIRQATKAKELKWEGKDWDAHLVDLKRTRENMLKFVFGLMGSLPGCELVEMAKKKFGAEFFSLLQDKASVFAPRQ